MTDCPTEDGFRDEDNAVVVTANIVSVRTPEVEVAKPTFPEYVAVMLSDPVGRLLVANVATPAECKVEFPISVDPL